MPLTTPIETAAIVRVLKKEPKVFGEIAVALGIGAHRWRELDVALQKARRTGLIKFDRKSKKWEAV